MLSDAGVIAETEMKAIPDHYVNVVIDRYVVMPNHVHAIVVIERAHVYSLVETGLPRLPFAGMGDRSPQLWRAIRRESAGFAMRKGFQVLRGKRASMTTSCDQTSP